MKFKVINKSMTFQAVFVILMLVCLAKSLYLPAFAFGLVSVGFYLYSKSEY